MNDRADYNVGTIENKVAMEIEDAIRKIDTLKSSLNSLKGTVNNTINNTSSKGLQQEVTKLEKFAGAFQKTFKFAGLVAGARVAWGAISNVSGKYVDMIETANLFEVQMGKVTDQYGNLDEAQSQYYTNAMEFQDKMNEKLATNKSEMMKYQAMYMGMLNSQLGDKDTASFMSEQLTKAGYDIASLYNLDIETAMNKLKSGLAGQIESLRQIGIDVSEASLSRVLDQVGIDRSVQQLSYAEKEVARYIAICQQAGVAQGDFARTFEQPANQIRVLKNQLAELGQVIGAFLVNAFGGILPVINGVVMAVKELLIALASLFGFDLNLSSGGSSLSSGIDSVADSASGAGSSLGKATKQAKEFKKQLMGFDEINNIEPPTQSAGGGGGGSGGGVGGAVDPALLNALKEWENQMDKIKGKAQEIRDKILDWLGVTDGTFANLKRILDVVGAIGWGLIGWKVSKKLLDFLQNLGVWKNVNAFQMAFGIGLTITGIYAQYKGIKRLLNGDVNLFSILETVLGTAGGALGIANVLRSINKGKAFTWGEGLKIGFGVMLAIGSFEVMLDGIKKGQVGKAILGALGGVTSFALSVKQMLGNATVKNTLTKVATWFTTLGGKIKTFTTGAISKIKAFASGLGSAMSGGISGLKSFASSLTIGGQGLGAFAKQTAGVVAGIAGIAGGTVLAFDSMKGLAEGTKDTTSAMIELGAGLATATASGALAGSQFGALGAVIGGLLGLATSAVGAIAGLALGLSNIDVNSYTKETNELVEAVKSSIDAHKEAKKAIDDALESRNVELQFSEQLIDSLDSVVDADGRVIKGQEKRADFILGELSDALGVELKRNGDVITKNGEVVGSLQNLQGELRNTVTELKKEAEQEANIEGYKEAMKTKISLQNQRKRLSEQMNKLQEEYARVTEGKGDAELRMMYNTNSKYKELCDNIATTKDAISDLSDTEQDNFRNLWYYEGQLYKSTGELADGTVEANAQVAESANQTADQINQATESINQTNEATKLSFENLSASMLESGEVTQEQFTTMIAEGGQQLQDMVKNNVDKWNELYDSANTAQQASMLAQSTTLQTWSPQLQAKWAEMAKNSATDFKNNIDSVAVDTRSKILSAITNTQTLSPEMIESWRKMSADSNSQYNMALQSVDEDTRMILQASINGVENLAPTEIQKWAEMAKNSKDRYNQNLASLDDDTRNKLQSAVNEINAKRGEASNASGSVAKDIRGNWDGNLGDLAQSAYNWLRGFINVIGSGNPLGIVNVIGGLTGTIMRAFNKGLGNASPSKKTKQSATYFMQGFQKQVSRLKSGSLRQVQDLGQSLTGAFDNSLGIAEIGSGIRVNTKDFSVDTNQYIDYGSINGKIQSTVTVNGNIGKQIADEVRLAIQNAEVNVNIEARADEGVIVEKASQGFKDYVTQTGELPFPVPAG